MKRKIALIIATTGATLAAVSFPLEPYATTYQAIMQTEVQQQKVLMTIPQMDLAHIILRN